MRSGGFRGLSRGRRRRCGGLGIGVADLPADERCGRGRFRGGGCRLRLLDGPFFHGELHRPGPCRDAGRKKDEKCGEQVHCFHAGGAFPGEVAISGGILPEKRDFRKKKV